MKTSVTTHLITDRGSLFWLKPPTLSLSHDMKIFGAGEIIKQVTLLEAKAGYPSLSSRTCMLEIEPTVCQAVWVHAFDPSTWEEA